MFPPWSTRAKSVARREACKAQGKCFTARSLRSLAVSSSREGGGKELDDRIPRRPPQFDVKGKARDRVTAAFDQVRQRRVFDEVGGKSAELAEQGRAACKEPAASEREDRERIRACRIAIPGAHEIRAALEDLASC